MSPEQARGKIVDRRSDIFSFGCVLYEMLTGGQSFPGESVTDSLGAILHREPDWSFLPVNTPPSLSRLLRRCLAKDKKQRLQDIGDARIELDQAIVELANPSLGFPMAAPESSGLKRWRIRRVVGAAIAAVMLGGVAGWWLSHRGPDSSEASRPFHFTIPALSHDTRAGGFDNELGCSIFTSSLAGRNTSCLWLARQALAASAGRGRTSNLGRHRRRQMAILVGG